MTLPIIVGCAAFVGFMIAVALVPAAPGLSIKLLELLRIYPQGRLRSSKVTSHGDAGHTYDGLLYSYALPDGGTRSESARVFFKVGLVFVVLATLLAYALTMTTDLNAPRVG